MSDKTDSWTAAIKCCAVVASPPCSPWPSSLPLKPPASPQYRDALVHYPLAHAQITVDPFLKLFAFGDLVLVEAGAKVPRGRVLSANHVLSLCNTMASLASGGWNPVEANKPFIMEDEI